MLEYNLISWCSSCRWKYFQIHSFANMGMKFASFCYDIGFMKSDWCNKKSTTYPGWCRFLQVATIPSRYFSLMLMNWCRFHWVAKTRSLEKYLNQQNHPHCLISSTWSGYWFWETFIIDGQEPFPFSSSDKCLPNQQNLMKFPGQFQPKEIFFIDADKTRSSQLNEKWFTTWNIRTENWHNQLPVHVKSSPAEGEGFWDIQGVSV